MVQTDVISFDQLFARYQRKLLQRHFHYIGQMGSAHIERGRPTLYTMNHSSWWDGLLAFHAIQQEDSGTHYIVVDRKQMNRIFSRKQDSAQSSPDTLQSTIQQLHQGERVWLFPQGEIQHLDQRPLSFQTDVGYLLQKCPQTRIKPVTVQYQFGEAKKPEATIWFGETFSLEWSALSPEEITRYLEVRMEKQLDEHKSRLLSYPVGTHTDFVPLLKKGRADNSKKWFPFSF